MSICVELAGARGGRVNLQRRVLGAVFLATRPPRGRCLRQSTELPAFLRQSPELAAFFCWCWCWCFGGRGGVAPLSLKRGATCE
jgi:hypothetical protein